MATRLKPVGHDDRLSLVEHLEELRSRIVFSLIVFSIIFGVCLWQDNRILSVINEPLAKTTYRSCETRTKDPLEQANCWQQSMKGMTQRLAGTARALAAAAGACPASDGSSAPACGSSRTP